MLKFDYNETKIKVRLTEHGEEWFALKEHYFLPDKLPAGKIGRAFEVDEEGFIELTVNEMRYKSHGKIDHHTAPLFQDEVKVVIDEQKICFSLYDKLKIKLTPFGVEFFEGLYREIPAGVEQNLKDTCKIIPVDEDGYIEMSIYDILARTEYHVRANRPLFEDEVRIDENLILHTPARVRK